MASLTKKKTCKFWIAVITLSDGRRTNRSTGTTDRKAAQKTADLFQQKEDEGKAKLLTERAVRRTLNEILHRNTGESLNNESIEEFLQSWLVGKDNEHTRERYQVVVSGFLTSLGPKSNSLLPQVTYKDIQTFLEKRVKAKISSKTLSLEAKALSAAFNKAKKMHIIDENPVEKALALRPIKVKSNQKSVFTEEEVQQLIASANRDWKAVILIGIYSGARLSDCANMRWGNVDFKKKQIAYFSTKNSKNVLLPLHTALCTYLLDLYSNDAKSEFISPSLCNKTTSGKSGLSQSFANLMEFAKIDRQQIAGQGKRKFSMKSFHSLRHTFNSTLANSGVSQEIRMKLIGIPLKM